VHIFLVIDNFMIRYFFLIILLFITSCRWVSDASTSYAIGTGFKVPPGSPVFQQGFKDGCSQIFYSRGNMFYRWRHKYNYNTKLNGNSEYRFGYTRGKSFCFNYIVGGVSSFDRMLFPHKDPIVAQDYNTTVDGMFGGVDSPIPAADNGGLNGLFDMWAGSGSTSALGANPLWAGGSSGQFFGQ